MLPFKNPAPSFLFLSLSLCSTLLYSTLSSLYSSTLFYSSLLYYSTLLYSTTLYIMGLLDQLSRKAGVIAGDDVLRLFEYAQEKKFALPAVVSLHPLIP